jgi:hypothetical protein
MRLTLAPHPDTPCAAVREIAVDVAREGSSLSLRFEIDGDIAAIAFPRWRNAARADELWKRTCLEAFVGDQGAEAYAEINLSPSNQWALYAFDGYRQGMRAPDGVERRDGVARQDAGRYLLQATLDLDRLEILSTGPWRLGLSAVIELKDGSKSYWALGHAPGQPDFHHPDAFSVTLPPESP